MQPGPWHGIIAAVFAIVAAFVGLKGIKYVARVATYLPLIPVAVLLILLVKTVGGLAISTRTNSSPRQRRRAIGPRPRLLSSAPGAWMGRRRPVYVYRGLLCHGRCGGTDIAANGRKECDVHIGGLTGIVCRRSWRAAAAILDRRRRVRPAA